MLIFFCFVFVMNTCYRDVDFPAFSSLFVMCCERILSSCYNVLHVCLPRCCCCHCVYVLTSVFCLGVFGITIRIRSESLIVVRVRVTTSVRDPNELWWEEDVTTDETDIEWGRDQD